MSYLCEPPTVGAEKPKKVDDMDMVQCSNENCRNMLGEHNTNWFHYGCVGFNPDIDTDYYCSDNCRKERLDKYLYCTIIVNYKLSNYGGHDNKNA